MTFEELFLQSVKKFYAGVEPTNYAATKEGGLKYTKKYFDEVESSMLNSDDAMETKKLTKKVKKEVPVSPETIKPKGK